ncbi:Uncharacterized protein TCM_001602 [Theobroma cacao]|uniref:DUF1985 domain-containing protein n=1 Tax=Theobroma cacao TaxID=3641 RepID=A0A061DJ98_THECC|nr:Uncharacterized protein TCM_001602 [Theobroma cacao]
MVGMCDMSRQYEDLDNLRIVLREKWAFNVTINTHYRIHAQYWKGQQSVKLLALLHTFHGGNFERLGDTTKMALILIANNILFGQDYRRQVMPWLLSLVEDIDAWNAFPWGHYVWRLMLNFFLKGFEVPSSKRAEGSFRLPLLLRRTSTHECANGNTTRSQKTSTRQLRCWSHLNKHIEDRADWSLGAREKRRNLKHKRATGFVKRRRTTTAVVDELSVSKLMEEGDDHGNGSEELLDNATIAPQPLRGPPQTHSANNPSIRSGGPSSHGAGEDHDELGVHIHDDAAGVDGYPVLDADTVIDASAEGEGDRYSVMESSDVHHCATQISDPTEQARVKMASKYRASPYVDPSVSCQDVKSTTVEPYEGFKKDECARRKIRILGDQGVDFFTTLKDLKKEMTSEHIDTCLSVLCKRITRSKSKLYTTRACVVDTIFFDTIHMLHALFPTEYAWSTTEF